MKCNNCGFEFEGKFCPECGTAAAQKKFCPECGSEVGSAKFCSNCGHALTKTNSRAGTVKVAKKGGLIGRAYFYLRYVPFALFVLFSALLFAFFAAPLVVVPSIDFFGTKTPAESLGNVYSNQNPSDTIPEINAASSALLVIALLTLFVIVALAVMLFIREVADKRVSRKTWEKGRLSVTSFRMLAMNLSYVSIAFYIVFVIISSVIIGKIAAFDDGLGLIVAGACPKLIISFSIIFLVLTVASAVARMLIGKRYPFKRQAELLAEVDLMDLRDQKVPRLKEGLHKNSYAVMEAKVDSILSPFLGMALGLFSPLIAILYNLPVIKIPEQMENILDTAAFPWMTLALIMLAFLILLVTIYSIISKILVSKSKLNLRCHLSDTWYMIAMSVGVLAIILGIVLYVGDLADKSSYDLATMILNDYFIITLALLFFSLPVLITGIKGFKVVKRARRQYHCITEDSQNTEDSQEVKLTEQGMRCAEEIEAYELSLKESSEKRKAIIKTMKNDLLEL